MDILKVKQFEISRPQFQITGTLMLKDGHATVKYLDRDGSEKYIELKSFDLINLATLVLSEVNPEEYVVNKPNQVEVEITGSLILDEERKLKYPDGMDKSCIDTIIWILSNDRFELLSTDEYIEKIKDHINNHRHELESNLQYDCSNINPEFDVFDEWFYHEFGFINPKYGDSYYQSLPEWFENYVHKINDKLKEELGIEDNHYYRHYYNEYDYFELMISRSFFYLPFDGFNDSPQRLFLDKFESKLSNDIMGSRIPSYGKSKDMAAELISTLNYSLYRWFNDGDLAEDILHDPNCIPLINVVTYLSQLPSKDSIVFTRYMILAKIMVMKYYKSNKSNEYDWDSLKNMSLEYENNNHSRRRHPFPKEIKDKIDKGEIYSSSEDYSDVETFNSGYVEFLLNDSAVILIAIVLTLEHYPDWLKDKQVYDFRSKFYLINDRDRRY